MGRDRRAELNALLEVATPNEVPKTNDRGARNIYRTVYKSHPLPATMMSSDVWGVNCPLATCRRLTRPCNLKPRECGSGLFERERACGVQIEFFAESDFFWCCILLGLLPSTTLSSAGGHV